MCPKLFNVDFLDTFTIMIILGIGFFSLIYLLKIRKYNLNKELNKDLIIILIISGIVMYLGAHIFDTIFHTIENGVYTKGGITYLGGFFCAVVCFIYLLKLVHPEQKKNILFYLNIIIIGIVIAHMFGRIGCFCAGCCYGKETSSFLGITFKQGSYAYFIYGQNHSLLPTQLFEAGFLLIMFIVLLFLKKNQFIIYCFSYGIFRFILEFFRGDSRGELFILSPSQWLSIILIIIGILLLIKKPNQEYIDYYN